MSLGVHPTHFRMHSGQERRDLVDRIPKAVRWHDQLFRKKDMSPMVCRDGYVFRYISPRDRGKRPFPKRDVAAGCR
jgi:hypothetical protein